MYLRMPEFVVDVIHSDTGDGNGSRGRYDGIERTVQLLRMRHFFAFMVYIIILADSS